jgi:hypothetical protein
MNFAKGVLESRNVTYDRSVRKLAKPLPLDTPTTIELSPGNFIQVTLIDANHCVGAVMFLIVGNGKAILYTGDIRAETWWVNSLVRNPVLLPYTLGNRRLDCMYLDTTFATKSEPYKEFPSKAEGIRELLEKVSKYSDDTVFYFHSWTFGYENVWVALSNFLGSRIHLDDYRARIYGSLSTLDKRQLKEIGLNVQSDNKFIREAGLEIHEAPVLCGFRNGNHVQPGCLTSRESVRIHSCERGTGCRVMNNDKNSMIVHIIPIVTRTNGVELGELGAGGGKGDMDRKEEIETGDATAIGKLMEMCAKTIEDEQLLSKVLALLQQTLAYGGSNLDPDMQLRKSGDDDQDNTSLQKLISILSSNASKSPTIEQPQNRTIRFPYSRHSSYSELCELVAAFKPKDMFPCTVDESSWSPNISMQSLFGDHCSDITFRHDAEMLQMYNSRIQREVQEKRGCEETQPDSQTTDEQPFPSPVAVKRLKSDESDAPVSQDSSSDTEFTTPVETPDGTKDKPIDLEQDPLPASSPPPIRPLRANLLTSTSLPAGATSISLSRFTFPMPITHLITSPSTTRPTSSSLTNLAATSTLHTPSTHPATTTSPLQPPTPTSTLPLPSNTSIPSTSSKPRQRKRFTNRQLAHEAAIGTLLTWFDYGGLESTRRREDREDDEL